MTHVTCSLSAKNRDQVRNPTLGNRVWATFFIATQMIVLGNFRSIVSRKVETTARSCCGWNLNHFSCLTEHETKHPSHKLWLRPCYSSTFRYFAVTVSCCKLFSHFAHVKRIFLILAQTSFSLITGDQGNVQHCSGIRVPFYLHVCHVLFRSAV